MRPYPFDELPRITRDDAVLTSVVARWLAARPAGAALAAVIGGPARIARATVTRALAIDPEAAACEVRVAGAVFDVRATSAAIRAIAQRLLGGPDELPAWRQLTAVERALWSAVVAAALVDAGIAGEAWPVLAPGPLAEGVRAIELAVELAGIAATIAIVPPSDLALRAPPDRPPPAWAAQAALAVPIVVGRCAIARDAVARLAVRDVITLARPAGAAATSAGSSVPRVAAELQLLGGVVGLAAVTGAVVAEVVTGYVPHVMSLPDAAHLELTVAMGTSSLSLRDVFALAVGQIVPLGRPLAGPFELRAGDRVIGHGELIDVEGELAVRVVSLAPPAS